MDTNLERHNLLWAIQRSSRYHARRQAFSERWRRVTAGVAVIFGSAAVTDLVKEGGHEIAIAASFIVAITSAVDLVVGTADMAWQHRELRRRYISLEGEILKSAEEPPESSIHRWQDERLSAEAEEPPKYVALDLLCENEMSRAQGDGDRVVLKPWERLSAHWWRWEDLVSRAMKRPLPAE
jgi:hypothetical protein